jgi:deazaflavin-dependent oxidoreductase (nitroreductase family)
MKWLARVGAVVLVVLAAVGGVFLVGMRSQWPPVRNAVRRMNRSFTNPRVLRTAGTPGASAGVIHHVGRRSGQEYRTPVGPFPTADGYVVALPYGPGTDWVQNVLAAGSATLVHEGETIAVERPEVVRTSAVVAHLPDSEQRTLRVFGVDECLLLHRAASTD